MTPTVTLPRRRMLLAGALVLALSVTGLVLTTSRGAGAHDHGVDAPDGFSAEVLAGHTSFPDDVAAMLRFRYAEPGDDRRTHVANLRDAGTVLVAQVDWEPGGTSGWHTHPGPVIVVIVDGAVDVINADDCLARTYAAGEAFIDPGQGNVHVASNTSTEEPARGYAVFLGVPAGQPATQHVPPADC
jgi:quercetin dioxygenase-like cupin family protein